MTYKEVDAKLQGRCFMSRKVGNHTYLKREGSVIHLRLHSTDIITWHVDGRVVLFTGGWNTLTTKDRLNQYGPIRIHSHKGTWIFSDGPIEYEFRSNMTVYKNGRHDCPVYRRVIPNDPIVLADLKARNVTVRTSYGTKYAYA